MMNDGIRYRRLIILFFNEFGIIRRHIRLEIENNFSYDLLPGLNSSSHIAPNDIHVKCPRVLLLLVKLIHIS
jgi:hypothetical protein